MVGKFKVVENAPKPMGHYSHAVRHGDLLFLCGNAGIDPKTNEFVSPGNIEIQTRQTIENIRTILESHSLDLENVIKATCFIDDIDKFQAFDKVYGECFGDTRPVRSTVEVGRFFDGMCVEIEVVASFT